MKIESLMGKNLMQTLTISNIAIKNMKNSPSQLYKNRNNINVK